jgi:hypothetical protein
MSGPFDPPKLIPNIKGIGRKILDRGSIRPDTKAFRALPKEEQMRIIDALDRMRGVDGSKSTAKDARRGKTTVTRKKRNYKKEYANYQGSAEQIKRRSNRNKARRIMAKKGKVKKGDGKDVHHTTGNPMNNKKLAVKPKSKNRSFARTKTARKKNPRA